MAINEEKIKEKSCGAIIIRDNKILLVRELKGHWGLPKGHIELGETEEETAKREVKEETNLDVELDINKRYTIRYSTELGNLKEAVFFLAKSIKGDIKIQEDELSQVKWMNFDDAINTITYDNAKELLKKVLNDINLF